MTPLDYQKKVEELKKLKLENLSTLLGIIVKVGAAGGTVAVFGYCFFFIKFFPTGLQVGDTLFFLFVLLGIGITGTLVSGLGFISGLPWLWRNRLPGGPTTPTKQEIAAKIGLIVGSALFLYSCRYYLATAVQEGSAAADAGSNCWRTAHGGLAFIAALVYLYYAYRLMKNKVTSVGVTALWLLVMSVVAILLSGVDDSVALSFGGGIVAGGLYMTLAVDSLDWKKHGKKSLMPPAIFTLCAVLLPFVFGAGEKMFGFVFSSVGIRTEHTTLIVDRKNLHTLQAAADAKGVKLYTCEMAEDTHAISRADILWHGIGERSYVAIKGQKDEGCAGGGKTP